MKMKPYIVKDQRWIKNLEATGLTNAQAEAIVQTVLDIMEESRNSEDPSKWVAKAPAKTSKLTASSKIKRKA